MLGRECDWAGLPEAIMALLVNTYLCGDVDQASSVLYVCLLRPRSYILSHSASQHSLLGYLSSPQALSTGFYTASSSCVGDHRERKSRIFFRRAFLAPGRRYP